MVVALPNRVESQLHFERVLGRVFQKRVPLLSSSTTSSLPLNGASVRWCAQQPSSSRPLAAPLSFTSPSPISTLGALTDGHDDANEKVKFVFRNTGGTPTFHVGGAEVGVAPGDAWDYATVVKAVMRERRLKAGGEETPQVRVKVEEETPRMLMKEKGKGAERQRECNEQGSSKSAMDVTSTPVPPSRQFSREELDALRRGSLTLDCFDEVYEQGRQDFAFALDPSQPLTRALTEEEETEWHALWEALLRMDRMFHGPLRDNNALIRRSEEMVAAAAQRVRMRVLGASDSNEEREPQRRERRAGFYVPAPEPPPDPASSQPLISSSLVPNHSSPTPVPRTRRAALRPQPVPASTPSKYRTRLRTKYETRPCPLPLHLSPPPVRAAPLRTPADAQRGGGRKRGLSPRRCGDLKDKQESEAEKEEQKRIGSW
ncbi:Aldo-ket-red domain-containing protein [Mycena venus]|uniref:Aldo-ket-red domain-containing protein n=1 Tax=Mycena venus TaxID=2733690 RepID=A0A8H7CNA1_9AGAR|nr:Aldo-ket-red domain-containing protein [Mycena venus]